MVSLFVKHTCTYSCCACPIPHTPMIFWADSTRPILHVFFILYIKNTHNTDCQNNASYEFHNCCFCGNVTIIIVNIYWSLGHF